jgi:hypothetical protein
MPHSSLRTSVEQANHINCKDQREFTTVIKNYFYVVLEFSANEIVHTGYYALSDYDLMVCNSKK